MPNDAHATGPAPAVPRPLDQMLPRTYRAAPPPPGPVEPDPSSRRQRRHARARRKADKQERRDAKRAARGTLNLMLRRGLVLALALGLATVGWSLGTALTTPTNDALSAKFVEWVRDHGGNGVVDRVENWWYTHHPPRKGGTPAGNRLPAAHAPTATRTTVPSSTSTSAPPRALPVNIAPIAPVPLANEGVWAPTGKLVNGQPALYQTFLRPDPVHTSLVTGVVWMDTGLLKGVLYNGAELPGGGPWTHGAQVAPPDYPALVAAFNSAFKLDVSRGGYYTEGKMVRPLADGRASLVIKTDGTVSVGEWGRDAHMGSDIASVRQNLDLLVDNGQNLATSDVNDTAKWGATLGGKVFVWRSGVGVDAHGNLIYVGGPGLNITTLAGVLVKAGAVRAMELDINTVWVSYVTFVGGDGTVPLHGVNLLQNMQRSPDHYVTENSRDFIALFAR